MDEVDKAPEGVSRWWFPNVAATIVSHENTSCKCIFKIFINAHLDDEYLPTILGTPFVYTWIFDWAQRLSAAKQQQQH